MSFKALFLDRDGVINLDHNYVYKVDDIDFVEGIFDLAKVAVNKGYILFVVTNQAGIGRGKYSEEEYQLARDYIEKEFLKNSVVIKKTYHCPYHPEHGIGEYKKDSEDRKPNPGMILKARDEFDIDLNESLIIGDRESDIEAGINAGIKIKILFDPDNENPETKADHIVSKLTDVEQYL